MMKHCQEKQRQQNNIEQLELKGYTVGTRYLAVHWMCSLEWHGRVKSFFGATENEAIAQANKHVLELEESYRLQQERLRCEGCGEGG